MASADGDQRSHMRSNGDHEVNDDRNIGKSDEHGSVTEATAEASQLTKAADQVHEVYIQSPENATQKATDPQVALIAGDGNDEGTIAIAVAEPDELTAVSSSAQTETPQIPKSGDNSPAIATTIPEDVKVHDLTTDFSKMRQENLNQTSPGCSICNDSAACHCPPFKAYPVMETSLEGKASTAYYHSISAQLVYQTSCFEEIRLENYRRAKVLCDKKQDTPLADIPLVAMEAALDLLSDTVFGAFLKVYRFEVGPERVPFFVHADTLRRCGNLETEISRTAYRTDNLRVGCWNVDYTDQDVSTFRLFRVWLQHGAICPTRIDDGPRQVRLKGGATERIIGSRTTAVGETSVYDDDLARLYQFAKDKGLERLANETITCLMLQNDRSGQTATKGAVQILLDAFPNSTLSDLLVEDAATRLNEKTFSTVMLDYPPEYIAAIMKRILKDRDDPNWKKPSKNERRRRICTAHVHDSEDQMDFCRKQLLARGFGKAARVSKIGPEIHDLYASTVTVVVGPKRLHFIVHRGLICKRSGFFRGAFEGGFVETMRSEVELPDESVAHFALFLQWLYDGDVETPDDDEMEDYDAFTSLVERTWAEQKPRTTIRRFDHDGAAAVDTCASKDERDQVSTTSDRGVQTDASTHQRSLEDTHDIEPEPSMQPDDTTRSDGSSNDKEHRFLADFFIFADRRDVPKLRNRIMNDITWSRESGHQLLSSDDKLLETAFSSLPANSALCRWLIDEAAHCWNDKKDISEDLENLPPAFTAGLLRAFAGRVHQHKPAWRYDMCHYHDHATDTEREDCRAWLADWYEEWSTKEGMEPVS